MKIGKIIKHMRLDKPAKLRLVERDPSETHGVDMDKDEARAHLAEDVKRLADLQERLYAQDRWAVLVVLQGMDASGKDGVIKHVMSGINPQGCEVHSFKVPSAEELNHDYLWRTTRRLPERGHIGIFNRSYYEETLVTRVHPEVLANQKLPKRVVGDDIWQQRFDDIRAFERYLAHNGVLVLKFFLHISKEEQRRRFLDRLDEPAKRWKFSMSDVTERKLWDRYMAAYEDMIRATSHASAPWHVVPANNKSFAHLAVAGAMVKALDGLDLAFPKVAGKDLAKLAKVRKALLAEAKGHRKSRR
ncbi:MAG TPA: polyphosphate kinase 2 family protein [Xanthobacteraceae bacterium]